MPPGHHKRQTWGQGHREAEGAGALVQARGSHMKVTTWSSWGWDVVKGLYILGMWLGQSTTEHSHTLIADQWYSH